MNLTDRTTIVTDWECGMKRWWYKHEAGTGIVPAQEQVHFREGRYIHHDLSELLAGRPVETILDEYEWPPVDAPDWQKESIFRRAGWMLAFSKYILPRLHDEYDVVMNETELVVETPDLWVVSTADRVLRIKHGQYAGMLVVDDYKTVGQLGKSWSLSWPYQIQMHLQIRAVEEETQEKVAYARVIGLRKGYEKYGRLVHPYVYGYHNDKTDEWRTDYKTGFSARGVWDYLGTHEEWVEKCGEEVATGQFPHSHPIFYNERLTDLLLRDRALREAQVKEAAPRDRLIFEQRFSKCRPTFGSECPYIDACFNAVVNEDPLGSGLYVPREPHHELESIMEDMEDE